MGNAIIPIIKAGLTLIAILLLVDSAGADETQISSCTAILSPGTYILNQSILNSPASVCISIMSSNVIINGSGYAVEGIYKGYPMTATYGVQIYNPTTYLTNVTVKNLNLTKWYYGIYQYNASNVSIVENNVTSNGVGIRVISSRYSPSGFNILTDNTVISNSYGIYHSGIHSYPSYDTIINNTVVSNGYGIYLIYSNNNTLTNNSIIFNSFAGIYHMSSNNNSFYNNNFMNNSPNAYNISGKNIWDNGYPSGGNYWSDYNGIDNFNGPNQDMPGSDGIGDNTYNINGVQDRYPLMSPHGGFVPPSPSIPSEVVITGVLGRAVEGCIILQGDDGMTYELWNLSNDIPPAGSQVRVKGIIVVEGLTVCLAGIHFEVNEIFQILPTTGSINGTVKDNATKAGIADAIIITNTGVSTKTNTSGFYSLNVRDDAYVLTVTSEPSHIPNTSVSIAAVLGTTVAQDVELAEKPTGTINGTVINSPDDNPEGRGYAGSGYPEYTATVNVFLMDWRWLPIHRFSYK